MSLTTVNKGIAAQLFHLAGGPVRHQHSVVTYALPGSPSLQPPASYASGGHQNHAGFRLTCPCMQLLWPRTAQLYWPCCLWFRLLCRRLHVWASIMHRGNMPALRFSDASHRELSTGSLYAQSQDCSSRT